VQVALKFTNGTADHGTGSFSIVGLGGSGQPTIENDPVPRSAVPFVNFRATCTVRAVSSP